MTEYEVHWLIKELAATGADPQWVAEAIAIEQEVARAERVAAAALLRTQTVVPLRPRPQLRVVAAGPK